MVNEIWTNFQLKVQPLDGLDPYFYNHSIEPNHHDRYPLLLTLIFSEEQAVVKRVHALEWKSLSSPGCVIACCVVVVASRFQLQFPYELYGNSNTDFLSF